MTTLKTDKKFTIMLSAFMKGTSLLTNLKLTARMKLRLHDEYHVNPVECIGVWHGDSEVSFFIHTNSSSTVTEIKRLALDVYKQEAVLVSNNRKHDIQLHNSDATTDHIGKHFVQHANAKQIGPCYTVVNGCDYWGVTK